ncbi:MAG: hypothetical protein ACKVQJ_04965 [Pyrinomonadaceae bacterium]
MSKNIFVLLFLFIVTGFGSAGAATALAQAPDLAVSAWQGSATPLVETTNQYTTTVQNIGSGTANGVKIVIDFPVTNTSPNTYILGKLIGTLQSGCTLALPPNRTKVTCNLGTLLPNETRSVTFGFQFQVATTTPTLTSTASTTTVGEINPLNNVQSFTPTITYPDNIITQGNYLVSSCSGRALASFYDCEVSPGSIQSRLVLRFFLGGSLFVSGSNVYTGFWDQSALPNKSLHFTLVGGTTNLVFDGFASDGTCYKGITTFLNNPTYNAAYRICRQP